MSRSGRVRRVPPPPGPLPIVEPVMSRYTDWATAPSLTSYHPLFRITHTSRIVPLEVGTEIGIRLLVSLVSSF